MQVTSSRKSSLTLQTSCSDSYSTDKGVAEVVGARMESPLDESSIPKGVLSVKIRSAGGGTGERVDKTAHGQAGMIHRREAIMLHCILETGEICLVCDGSPCIAFLSTKLSHPILVASLRSCPKLQYSLHDHEYS